LGLEFYFGPPRGTVAATGFSEAAQVQVQGAATAPGFVAVPALPDAPAGAPAAPLALAEGWVAAMGLDAAALACLSVVGDDMAPGLMPGDLVILDTRFEPGPEAQLAAFLANGQPRLGWLVLPRAGWLVAFFARPYTLPVVHGPRRPDRILPLGEVIARFEGQVPLRLDLDEKHRLFDMAKRISRGAAP